jgi:Tol biopolymer transport system component
MVNMRRSEAREDISLHATVRSLLLPAVIVAALAWGGAARAAKNADPAVSQRGEVVFLSTQDGVTNIHLIRLDGSGERALTATKEAKEPPRWSRDGRRVLFGVKVGETMQVVSIDRSGRHQRSITTVTGRGARISPDGTKVLYATGSWTAVHLYVANVDGSHPVAVTDGTSVAWNPEWSPDSRTIAFTGRTNDRLDIWLVGSGGGASPRQLTHIESAEGQAQVPSWSPDGRTLAVQVSSKDDGHIWLVDAATGDAHEIAPHAAHYRDELPAWFPDGKRLAFQSDRTGTMQVWTMNADGSGQRQVTH